ncbi:RNA-directed DNA polymerase, eukaryota, partial [Tanacetum coccineum]
DFEKAYDSVRWDFLDDILVKFGFGIKWRGWIQNCLNSSKGSILINGSPTEEFQFYKGLKQGDPLSPFLFVLVMESLHISFQRMVDVGMFTGIKLSSSLNIKIKSRLSNWKLTSFWKDKWHNEGVLKDVFPRLYALERHQNVTIHTKLIDYGRLTELRVGFLKLGKWRHTSFLAQENWINEGVLKDVFPRLYALERHQNVTIHTKLIDYSLVNSFRRNPRSGVEEFQLDISHRTVGLENVVLVDMWITVMFLLWECYTWLVSLRRQAISKRSGADQGCGFDMHILESAANNDLNVLYGSPLFDDEIADIAPECPFIVNGHTYRKGYYLADGIYPEWSTFVKTFSVTRDAKTFKFKTVQEAARKDIERAFGVLQGKRYFAIEIRNIDLRQDLVEHLWE